MNAIKRILFGVESLPDQLLWLRRKETWNGDVKANYMRFACLAIFTINEFLNYYVFHVVDKKFHIGSLLIVVIWLVATVDFHIVLKNHWIPQFSPYLIPSIDLFLLTWLLFLADGTRSPLVVLYFPVIALAAIRLNPSVVLYTAGAASFGYLSVWDFTKHQKPEFLVPCFHVVIFILGLWSTGIILSHLLGRFFALMLEKGKP
jgi:hypothetical protein